YSAGSTPCSASCPPNMTLHAHVNPLRCHTDLTRGNVIFGLVPAEYDVTARQIGMAPQRIHVRVLIGEVYPLDFKLAASAIQVEAVTVVAAAGVETRTSEVATNVTQQQINNLHSSSRNFLDLA